MDTDWSGAYAGVSVGAGGFDFANGLVTDDYANFGVHAGYLHDMGNVVVGGEIQHTQSELDTLAVDMESNRLKGILGYDAGAFMAYGVAGVADADINGTSDTMLVLGAGGSYAINDRFRVGAELIVEQNDDFNGSGIAVENQEIGLRMDYSF